MQGRAVERALLVVSFSFHSAFSCSFSPFFSFSINSLHNDGWDGIWDERAVDMARHSTIYS